MNSASLAKDSNRRTTSRSFFTLRKTLDRWWFVEPSGRLFFSLGLNHIDYASLLYPETGDLWKEKYNNSVEIWLKNAVRPDLQAWGFNSVGWVQEWAVIEPITHRHSRGFTFEEYQWLGMPYCHLLNFVDFHQWDDQTRYPDFFTTEFEDRCDYVARSECARMAEDDKLIGYFYADCPTWAHTWAHFHKGAWKGPLFDPDKLKTETGRKELFEIATRYYRVTHDAIRRYDKNHLILGDRYEARAFIPKEVVSAALPWVDILSFQDFGEIDAIRANLERWAAFSGKPVLIADSASHVPTADGWRRHDPEKYRQKLAMLRQVPACVGFHLCGAYLRNKTRRYGLRDAQEKLDAEVLEAITAANRETAQWIGDSEEKTKHNEKA